MKSQNYLKHSQYLKTRIQLINLFEKSHVYIPGVPCPTRFLGEFVVGVVCPLSEGRFLLRTGVMNWCKVG